MTKASFRLIGRIILLIICHHLIEVQNADPKQTTSPQPILFESIGTMVASLSYLHTYIPLNLSAIEDQILRYREALTPDGLNYLPLLNVTRERQQNGTHRYFSKVGSMRTEISPLTIKLWDEIVDIHMREVDDLLLDIRTLKAILPEQSEDEGSIIQSEGKNVKHRPDNRPSPNTQNSQNDGPKPRNPQDEFIKNALHNLDTESRYPGPITQAKTIHKPSSANPTSKTPNKDGSKTVSPQELHGALFSYLGDNVEKFFPHIHNKTLVELEKRHRTPLGHPAKPNKIPLPSEMTAKYYEDIRKEYYPPPSGASDEQTNFNMGKINDMIKKGQSGLNMGDGGIHPIQKRALPLLLAGIAVAIPGILGTSLGIYSAAQINHLWTAVNANSQSINRLITVAEAHDLHLRELDAAVRDIGSLVTSLFMYNPSLLTNRLIRIENQIKHRIVKSTHLIQQAQHRRLPVDYLTDTDVKNLFSALVKRADTYGCSLAIDKHSDLYQLETSYLYNGEVISMILHVPMYPADALLRLYKLHPFPLPFYEEKFLIPDVKNDVLGIAAFDSAYYVQISASELLGCHRINQFYFCERNGVLAKTEDNTCLGALYHSKYELARKICNFHIEPVREFIYQLLDNWFIIYTPTALTIPTKCRNGTMKELFISKHITRFHLSPGCYAQFPNHRVFSDLSIKLPSDFVQLEWEWESVDHLFKEVVGAKYVLPELERLNQFGMDRPRLADLQTLLMQTQRNPWWSFSAFSTGTIVAIVLALILCVFIFIRCRARRQRMLQQKQQQHHHAGHIPMIPMGHGQGAVHYAATAPAVHFVAPPGCACNGCTGSSEVSSK